MSSSSNFPANVPVWEHEEQVINDCPPEIGKQLERAAFTEKSANVFVKTRTTQDGNSTREIVEARIEGNQLTVSVNDIVGIVQLTPNSKLQIKPKIPWSEVLEMLLTVRYQNRSIDYHGIPIHDFLADDIELKDIFIIIAINYLESIEPIHKYGFIREFGTHEYDALDGRGRIDVQESLRNISLGINKQRFVERTINYNTPINAIIHYAGKLLLNLFNQHSKDYNHHEFFQIYSSLREEVKYLEKLGISSERYELVDFHTLQPSQIPPNRDYYYNATRVAKTIISSSTGEAFDPGTEELTVDYIIDMNNLFEEYSQIILEDEVDNVCSSEQYQGDGDIRVAYQQSTHIYEDSTHQIRPDHIIYQGSKRIAILDSKYYKKGSDPTTKRSERTQIMSYAYLLECNKLAFLCPHGSPISRSLEPINGEIQLLCVEDEFDTSKYREQIRDYIELLFENDLQTPEIYKYYSNYEICYPTDKIESIESLYGNTDLLVRNINAGRIFHDAINKSHIRLRNIKKKQRAALKQVIRNELDESESHKTCIPFFLNSFAEEEVGVENVSNWEGDMLALFFVDETQENKFTISKSGPLPLDWLGNKIDYET